MKSDLLNRRTVLKGLGTVMALPWLEAMGLQTGWAAVPEAIAASAGTRAALGSSNWATCPSTASISALVSSATSPRVTAIL